MFDLNFLKTDFKKLASKNRKICSLQNRSDRSETVREKSESSTLTFEKQLRQEFTENLSEGIESGKGELKGAEK